MPAKMKFTRGQITDAALELIREKGASALSARGLAKKLGTSPQPIFSYFDNMEEVRLAAIDAAKELYAGYVREGLRQTPAFKGVGMEYILFAENEPELFRLLFMTEKNTSDVRLLLPNMDDNYSIILDAIIEEYALGREDAERLYLHLAIYTHGIAALSAGRVCALSEEETARMLSEVFTGLIKEIKGAKR